MPDSQAKPSRARNFFGRVIDAVALGQNYNRDTGQFRNVLPGLIGRGAGVVAGLYGGLPAATAVNKGGSYLINRFGQPVNNGADQPERAAFGKGDPSVSPPNVSTQPGMNLGLPSIGRPQMGGVSNYGPYQGGYQFGAPQGTTSGLPNVRTSYGVSLPNYGGQMGGSPQPQAPMLTPQQMAEQARIAKNNSYGSPSMFATGGTLQAGGAVNMLGTGGAYLK